MASLTDLVAHTAVSLQTVAKNNSEMLGQFWALLGTSGGTVWSWRVLVDPAGLREGRGSPPVPLRPHGRRLVACTPPSSAQIADPRTRPETAPKSRHF